MADCIIESICVTFVDEDTWPVFVFPDHSVPTSFLTTRPSSTTLPVLLLRRHSLQWRSREELMEFVPSDYYEDTKEDDTERGRAFQEALEANGMDHYHKLITEKERTVRKAQNSVFLEHDDSEDDDTRFTSSSARKRPYSSMIRGRGLLTPSTTPRKARKSSFNFNMFDQDDEDDDVLPDPATFTPSKRPTQLTSRLHSKAPVSGARSGAPNDYVARKQLEMLTTKKKDAKQIAQEEAEKVIGPTKDPSKVNVYVGPDSQLFIIDKDKIEKHPNLANVIEGDYTEGFEIRTKAFKKISPKLWQSLSEWLNDGDYKPLLVEPTDREISPYLKDTKTQSHFEASAETASLLWDIAHKFDLEDLKQLVYRKVRAQWPLEPTSALLLTRMVYWNPVTGTEIDEKLRLALQKDLCRRWYYILEREPLSLARILKQNGSLAREIYKWLGENLQDQMLDEAQKASDEEDSDSVEEQIEIEY